MLSNNEKQKRIENGELPYLDPETDSLVFRKAGQVDYQYCSETGKMLYDLPTENSLHVGLHGLCRVLHWNSISQEEFQHLIADFISIDELRDIIDRRPHDGGTTGIKLGGVPGVVHGYIETYEAYRDKKGVVSHFPLKFDNLAIRELSIPVAGQYVLFSLDEDTWPVGAVNIPDCKYEESKLELYVDRFRFGEIYFDMIRMKYEDQVVDECSFFPPLTSGFQVFALDPSGMMHRVFVPYDEGIH